MCHLATLEGKIALHAGRPVELERRPIGMHLTPLRITDIQLAIQEVCVKVRKG